MKRLFLWGLASLLLLFAVGCARGNGANANDQTATAPAIDTNPAPTRTPEPSRTATPTPEPTPLSPGVVIVDQPLDESGVLVAERVTLPGPGWLAIYRAVDGVADTVIGQLPLTAGEHEDVAITIDTAEVTAQLFAGVHVDVGAEGVFDFPGEDEPYPGEPEATFEVELLLPQARIEASDQAVADDGVLSLALVEALAPTWVVIHSEADGQIGPAIGARLLEPGVHENVSLTIDWRRATPALYAVLHEDDGERGVLDYPTGDQPLLQGGEPILAAFKATYPPEILVYDQPVIDGTIMVERAISQGPGWVVIYNEAGGQPGFIIGAAPLEDGLNEAVVVDLRESALTTQLFAWLHQDTTPGDEFDFPGQDPPVLYEGRMPRAATFRTDQGAQAFVNDQMLTDDGAVTIAIIVAPAPVWAVIYDDADGQPGEMLGQTWVPAGVNRGVTVDIDPSTAAGPLYLVIHWDDGVPEEFEALDIDPPLTYSNNQPVQIPFNLLENATAGNE
jgi:hypothetical protein